MERVRFYNLMTSETSLLLRLVRAALWQDPTHLDGFPHLSEHEWTQIYRESKRQTVSGIALDGVGMLPDHLFPPRNLLLRWVARGDSIERTCRKMERDLRELLEEFHASGLHPLLQKGLAVGRFYPRPYLRVSGDIDLWFDADSRKKADSLIALRGVKMCLSPDGATVYRWGETEVEHHSDLIELMAPRARRRVRPLAKLPSRCVTVAAGLNVDVPAALPELLLISVHIMKHCFGAGIGLRHLCDYAVAREKLMPQIGEEQWRDACRRLGILCWSRVLDTFTDLYLSPKNIKTKLKTDYNSYDIKLAGSILSLIEEGGNFGLHNEALADRRLENNLVKRKFGTMRSFLRHAALSARLAPSEAMSVFLSLVKGNIKNKLGGD